MELADTFYIFAVRVTLLYNAFRAQLPVCVTNQISQRHCHKKWSSDEILLHCLAQSRERLPIRFVDNEDEPKCTVVELCS